jgi:hypothetical protein
VVLQLGGRAEGSKFLIIKKPSCYEILHKSLESDGLKDDDMAGASAINNLVGQLEE